MYVIIMCCLIGYYFLIRMKGSKETRWSRVYRIEDRLRILPQERLIWIESDSKGIVLCRTKTIIFSGERDGKYPLVGVFQSPPRLRPRLAQFLRTQTYKLIMRPSVSVRGVDNESSGDENKRPRSLSALSHAQYASREY